MLLFLEYLLISLLMLAFWIILQRRKPKLQPAYQLV